VSVFILATILCVRITAVFFAFIVIGFSMLLCYDPVSELI
jgi:hypothetical protein